MSARAMFAALAWVVAAPLAAVDATPRDGWASWEIDATAQAPAWCCMQWERGVVRRTECNLDGEYNGFSSDDDHAPATTLRVYARYADGRIVDSRAYAPDCPVRSATPIADLGRIGNEASLARLTPSAPPGKGQRERLLPVLAVHAGPVAMQTLEHWLAPSLDAGLRRDVLFWLGQVRAAEAAPRLRSTLAKDPSAKMREHAAFVVAQTKEAWRDPALVEAARGDASEQVRGQAWFWLAQTGSVRAEAEIDRAFATERSSHVREQMVFALSQLPDARGTKALIAIVDDSHVARAERKRALFWLAQSEDEAALAYLDRRLGVATR